jgi:hypothetical protein
MAPIGVEVCFEMILEDVPGVEEDEGEEGGGVILDPDPLPAMSRNEAL